MLYCRLDSTERGWGNPGHACTYRNSIDQGDPLDSRKGSRCRTTWVPTTYGRTSIDLENRAISCHACRAHAHVVRPEKDQEGERLLRIAGKAIEETVAYSSSSALQYLQIPIRLSNPALAIEENNLCQALHSSCGLFIPVSSHTNTPDSYFTDDR